MLMWTAVWLHPYASVYCGNMWRYLKGVSALSKCALPSGSAASYKPVALRAGRHDIENLCSAGRSNTVHDHGVVTVALDGRQVAQATAYEHVGFLKVFAAVRTVLRLTFD